MRSRLRVSFRKPIYPHNLLQIIAFFSSDQYLRPLNIPKTDLGSYFTIKKFCFPLANISRSQYLNKEIISEFVFTHDRVACSRGVRFLPSRYKDSYETFLSTANLHLIKIFKILTSPFHKVAIRQKIVFPNKSLLVFDCGKMNKMIQLLKTLKQ